MPVIFRCKSCKGIIYVFRKVGQDCFGLPTPSELIIKLNGRCPYCGRSLDIPTIDDIKVVGRVQRGAVEGSEGHIELVRLMVNHGGLLKTASVNQ